MLIQLQKNLFSVFSFVLVILTLGCASEQPEQKLPPPSQIEIIDADNSSIDITFKAVPDAKSYKLYFSTQPEVEKTSSFKTLSSNTYSHQGLEEGTTYYYRLSTVSGVYESSLSTEVEATTTDSSENSAPQRLQQLSTPTNIQILLTTSNALRIGFDALKEAQSYRLYYSKDSNVTKNSHFVTSVKNVFDYKNLENNTTYYFRISALSENQESTLSDLLNATTQDRFAIPISYPTNIKTENISFAHLTISFDSVPMAQSYKIYFSQSPQILEDDQSIETSLTTIETSLTTYKHINLLADTDYYYRVSAVNAWGESPLSPEKTIKTLEEPEWQLQSDKVNLSIPLQNPAIVNDKIWLQTSFYSASEQQNQDSKPFIFFSADGITWDKRYFDFPERTWGQIYNIFFNGDSWYIQEPLESDKGKLLSSQDLVNWSEESHNATWAMVGGGELRPSHSRRIFFKGQYWSFGGKDKSLIDDNLEDTSEVWKSSDGVSWTKETNDAPWTPRTDYHAHVLQNTLYFFGGTNKNDSGQKLADVWSFDGATWTRATGLDVPANIEKDYTTTVFDNKIWLSGAKRLPDDSIDNFVYSFDGTAWTQEPAPPWKDARGSHSLIAFKNQLWAGVAEGNPKGDRKVWSSTDGKSWTLETAMKPNPEHQSVVFQDKMWIVGGYDNHTGSGQEYNDIWSSTDGKSWTLEVAHTTNTNVRWTGRSRYVSLNFKQKLWLLGGHNGSERMNDVWSSTDGKSWTLEAPKTTNTNIRWSSRMRHQGLVFDDKIWILGGNGVADGEYQNDVWSSTDGKSWNLEAPHTTDNNIRWTPRYAHASTVFNNKMWVMGGKDQNGLLNDVWSSTDGKKWTQETSEATWKPRSQHTTVVFDEQIWIIGGDTRGQGSSSIWSSFDGQNWTLRQHGDWAKLIDASSLLYQDQIWISGGYHIHDARWQNQVWRLKK